MKDKDNLKICKQLLESFVATGLVCIKNPYIDANKNEKFTDLMESYFSSRGDM